MILFRDYTYTRQLRSDKESMKLKSSEMSYVIDGVYGFFFLRNSSKILQTPEEKKMQCTFDVQQ